MNVRKVVIPVAGYGTRFLPATKASPKEMLPIIDKPVIQYIVEEAQASGIEQVIFVTSSNKKAIEDHFDKNTELERVLEEKNKTEELEEIQNIGKGLTFAYVRQAEQKGLGHAIACAKELVGDEPFIVCGGDDVIVGKTPGMKQLIEKYKEHNSPVIGAFTVPQEDVFRYGVIDPKEEISEGFFKLKGIIEKPEPAEAPSNHIAAARWLLTPDIFDILEDTEPGKGNEIQLTDAIEVLINNRDVYSKVIEGKYYDCGNKAEYLKAVVDFALERKELKDDFRAYIQNV
jgi:UTP--glucose-1-phosphate uridylyltransferase